MTIQQNDLRSDLKIGEQIFENIPNEVRPGWSGFILSHFDSHINQIPLSILELHQIIDNKERWKEAHQQFGEIRVFGLENKNYTPENYLRLAEIVAKVTYNASGEPAPFDKDSGHYIASLALAITAYFGDHRLEQEVKSAILLFIRSKKLRRNLKTAGDFFLYKKINDILWFDWDPIGVNDLAPSDEYQRYVPEIFTLVRAKADRLEIAKRLHKLQNELMGIPTTIDNSLIISDKILNIEK